MYTYLKSLIWVEKIADLVLSTTKLGFSDIIDKLISHLSPKSVDEGLI